MTDFCTCVGGGGTGFDGASTTLGRTAEDFGALICTWMPRSTPGSVGVDLFLPSNLIPQVNPPCQRSSALPCSVKEIFKSYSDPLPKSLKTLEPPSPSRPVSLSYRAL